MRNFSSIIWFTFLIFFVVVSIHANGPSSLDGKKISVTLDPSASVLTIYCEAGEFYINNNTNWESGTYSWDPASSTFGAGSLTARWGKVELVLDFSDGTLGLYEGSSLPLAKQVNGTFILSDYSDGEIPFNRFFSGSFAELVADNHLELPMVDGLQTSINDQGAFTISGTAEDFYPETGANSLLSLSQDWVVQGELFRSTGNEPVLISIESDRKAQFQLEVQAGLSNGGIFFNIEYERFDHEPFGDQLVGNYYSYSNLSVEMRIRNVAIENTFYVEWLNGTSWETLNALNWETGALTYSADSFSENALSTQLNRWEPMGDFVFNPQMEFRVDASDTNIAIDEIGFYSFSVTPSPPASIDTDGDGLTNAAELSLGTNPNLEDTDGDGFPDGWEVSRNLDPTVNSSDFISNINGYGYYSIEQISDLRPGSAMIEVQNGQVTLSMEVEQSDDLEIWTNESTTTLQIPIQAMEGEKFFRFKMNGSNSSEDADSSSDDSSDDGGLSMFDEEGRPTIEIGDGPITLYPQP